MPKKVYKINNFHGGLNNSSDPRDVDDKEITAATNVMVDEVGRVRLSGSNVAHDAPVVTSGAYGSITPIQVSGSGLFTFNHDRQGAEGRLFASEDPATVAEDGDSYLCLYDDSVGTGSVGPGVFIYSLDHDAWFDAWEDTDQAPIQFIGKTTSVAARPCFFSVDGAVRVSTGEFAKYDSGTDINMGSHLLVTAVALTVDDGTSFKVGNYIKIDDEILFVSAIATHVLTVTRAMFGTKDVQHQDNADIYILNMNQWYGYLNNKLFQTSVGVSVYENNKWYNNIQHLRSLDELGISLILHDATSTSPAAAQINAVNKIVVAYWFTTTKKDVGFWNGTYWVGLTPVYEGGQEGPISTVGTSPLQINEEILNVQLYITHLFGEQISATNDRTFAGASNWTNAASSNAFNAYNETGSGVLTVTPDDDGSNRQYATLDGANWEDAGGASGMAMVVGRTYRLSYTLTVSSYTKGTLSIGTANDAYALQDVNTHTATFSEDTQTLDFVYDTDCDKIIIDAAVSSVFTAIFDNFSLIDASSITETDGHPLLDERITGLRLYTKSYTSDEWFSLKEFDLLEGGEHGWETYNSDAGANITSGGGNTLTGFWKTTSTADSLTLAVPSDTTSYGGPAESNTCTATLLLNQSKGAGRVGTLRLSGFDNSPLYLEVDLSSTSSQAKAFNVVNPAAGTHKFVVELLDENFNIMARGEREQVISDSGVTTSPTKDGSGAGGDIGSGSS
tara:strand:+ start:187 stop:2379 length:2193 start_codon:yes stop_codon:yes gene_type:complete